MTNNTAQCLVRLTALFLLEKKEGKTVSLFFIYKKFKQLLCFI